MKRTIGEISKFIQDGYSYQNKAKALCVELLESDEFPTHSISFEWDDGDAPSISSYSFSDEPVVDGYITRVFTERGMLYLDMHDYYNCSDVCSINTDIEP